MLPTRRSMFGLPVTAVTSHALAVSPNERPLADGRPRSFSRAQSGVEHLIRPADRPVFIGRNKPEVVGRARSQVGNSAGDRVVGGIGANRGAFGRPLAIGRIGPVLEVICRGGPAGTDLGSEDRRRLCDGRRRDRVDPRDIGRREGPVGTKGGGKEIDPNRAEVVSRARLEPFNGCTYLMCGIVGAN